MRKKTKKRRKRVGSKVSNLAPCRAFLSVKRKLHDEVEKLKQYLLTFPCVIRLLKRRDEISEKLKKFILAFFAFLSPCWTFLFIHKSKPNKKIKRIIETFIPNPFQDEPSDIGPTNAKSHGFKITIDFLHLCHKSYEVHPPS